LDYSYSNIDPVTDQPGRYVRRCILIEKIEPGRIIGKRVSLVSGERRDQTLDGEEWLDDAWAFVHRDGRVDADCAEETLSPVTKRFITSSPTSEAESPRAAALLAEGAELTVAGNEDKARAVLNEALAMCMENSDLVGHGNALRAIGFLDGIAGHYDKARACMADALALFRQGTHKTQEAYALMGLGNTEKALGRNEAAKQYFREAAAIYEDLGMTAEMEMAIANIGWIK
jgi:tetratricopeptide (TPR) repeat protein